MCIYIFAMRLLTTNGFRAESLCVFLALWMKMQVSFPYFGITVLNIRNCFAWTICVILFSFFLQCFFLGCVSNFSKTRQLLNVTNPQSMCFVRHRVWAVKAISYCNFMSKQFSLFSHFLGELVDGVSRYPHFNLYSV